MAVGSGILVDLGQVNSPSVSWFPHLQNGDIQSTCVIGPLWGLNEIRLLAQNTYILAAVTLFCFYLSLLSGFNEVKR